MVSVLYELHARHRHELYANLHGDKETFWLACELAGPPKQWRRNALNESGGPPHCGLSPLAGGEMGQMLPAGVSANMPAKKRAALMQAAGGVRCLRGNLAHHHPDTGALIHCNCKWPSAGEPPYTHVSLPTLSSTARRAQRDVFCSRPSLRVVSTGSVANADAPWLTLGVEWRQNTNVQLRATKVLSRACMAESATETIKDALGRLSGKHATPPPKWETPLPMGKGEKLEVIGDRATCDSPEYRGRVVDDKDLWRRDGEAPPPPLAGGSRGGAPMTHWPVVAKPDAEAAYERGAVDSGTCMVDRAGSGMVHCLPSLLCVGLAKAGTAELQGWINTHPSFVTAKVFEPHFFDTRLLWAAKDMGVVPTEALARTWTAYASLFPTPASALGNVMAFEKTPFGGLHGFTKKVRTIMGAHSAQPKEPHLALTSARTFADVRQRQRLARIIARGKKIGKKLKGKEAKNESAAVLTNVLHEVPHLVAQLLPSARLVIMLRDPVTMAPSRFVYCLRTTARPVKSHFRPLSAITNAAAGGGDTSAAKLKLRAKEMPTATERCGGEAVGELEASLVMTGLLRYSNNGTGPLASSALPAHRIDKLSFGPPTYRSADGQRLQRTRRIGIIDDYLQLIGIWYAAFPRTQLLIGFLEELASDAPSFMNRVLKLAGLPEYGWPEKARNSSSSSSSSSGGGGGSSTNNDNDNHHRHHRHHHQQPARRSDCPTRRGTRTRSPSPSRRRPTAGTARRRAPRRRSSTRCCVRRSRRPSRVSSSCCPASTRRGPSRRGGMRGISSSHMYSRRTAAVCAAWSAATPVSTRRRRRARRRRRRRCRTRRRIATRTCTRRRCPARAWTARSACAGRATA